MGKALILSLLLLAGCTTTPTRVDNSRQVWCDFNEPRRDYRPDMSRSEVDQINAHNALGAKWCGWQV